MKQKIDKKLPMMEIQTISKNTPTYYIIGRQYHLYKNYGEIYRLLDIGPRFIVQSSTEKKYVNRQSLRDTNESVFLDSSLIGTFNDLYNNILPYIAKNIKQFPISKPSEFYTTVIDTIVEAKWEDVIDRPAYKNMSDRQLRLCIMKMIEWSRDERVLIEDLNKSKLYRL